MNNSESVQDNFEAVKQLNPDQLRILLGALTEKAAAVMEPPPGIHAEDLFMSLDKDVRRWLHSLGEEENKPVKLWLLRLDEEKIKDHDAMLADWRNAKQWGKVIRVTVYAIGISISTVYGVAKAAPDVLDWLKRFLLR